LSTDGPARDQRELSEPLSLLPPLKHVDLLPGDRRNPCRGLMDPIGLHTGKKGYQIAFVCRRCGVSNVNRIAEQTQQPDNFDLLLRLMQQSNMV